jgi:hypothetical protein
MHRPGFRFFAALRFASFPVARSLAVVRAARTLRPTAAALRICACAIALGGALVACSPANDWRTIINSASGYSIDLPAKPTLDEHQIDIAGTPLKMQMQAAHTDGAVYAVGTVMLPSDDPRLQRTVLDYLCTGLARNLGAAPDARATQVPLAAGGMVLGLEMNVSGSAGDAHARKTIHARLVARGRHVYQAAVIADKEPQQEQIDQFFQSFKLY